MDVRCHSPRVMLERLIDKLQAEKVPPTALATNRRAGRDADDCSRVSSSSCKFVQVRAKSVPRLLFLVEFSEWLSGSRRAERRCRSAARPSVSILFEPNWIVHVQDTASSRNLEERFLKGRVR